MAIFSGQMRAPGYPDEDLARLKALGNEGAFIRGEAMKLNPNDPDYLTKLGMAHAAHGALEHEAQGIDRNNAAAMGTQSAADFQVMKTPVKRGIMGRIGHGLETAGKDVAIGLGSEFAPGAMQWIPGTAQYKLREQAVPLQLQEEKGRAEEAAATGARAQSEAAEQARETAAGLPAAKVEEQKNRAALLGEQAEAYKRGLGAVGNAEVQAAWQTLQDPNAKAEDRRAAMATLAQALGPVPMLRDELASAENIFREGEIGSRLMPVDRIGPDGTPIREWIPRESPPLTGLASPGFYPKQGTTYTLEEQPGGSWALVPKPTVSGPMLPGGRSPLGTTGTTARQVQAPGGAPLFGKLNTSESANLESIAGADNVAGQLLQTLNEINSHASQLGQAVGNRTMTGLYKLGFAPAQLQDQFIQLANVLKVVGGMPFAKASRSYKWIAQVQAHLSDSNATFAENLQRVQRLVKTIYPDLQRALFDGKARDNAPYMAEQAGYGDLYSVTLGGRTYSPTELKAMGYRWNAGPDSYKWVKNAPTK